MKTTGYCRPLQNNKNEKIAPSVSVWSKERSYPKGSLVTHTGKVYEAVIDVPANKRAPHTSTWTKQKKYWQEIVPKKAVLKNKENKLPLALEWCPKTSYRRGDVVHYHGKVYIAITNTAGLPPTDPVCRGVWEQCINEYILVYEWKPGMFHRKGTIVKYKGRLYEAVDNVIDSVDTPILPSNSGRWEVINTIKVQDNAKKDTNGSEVDLNFFNNKIKQDRPQLSDELQEEWKKKYPNISFLCLYCGHYPVYETYGVSCKPMKRMFNKYGDGDNFACFNFVPKNEMLVECKGCRYYGNKRTPTDKYCQCFKTGIGGCNMDDGGTYNSCPFEGMTWWEMHKKENEETKFRLALNKFRAIRKVMGEFDEIFKWWGDN